jgi:hypothetical protein
VRIDYTPSFAARMETDNICVPCLIGAEHDTAEMGEGGGGGGDEPTCHGDGPDHWMINVLVAIIAGRTIGY